MIEIKNHIVTSSEGRMIHRLGTEVYFPSGKGSATATDAPEAFEEVDAMPAPAPDESAYRAEVERLIAERYTVGQEIQFAREKELAGADYADYLAYVEECKVRAKSAMEALAATTIPEPTE